MPNLETMKPFINPMILPSKIPITIATITGNPDLIRRPTAAPEKATTEPTDMSKPPLTIKLTIATAIMVSMESPKSKAKILAVDKKIGRGKTHDNKDCSDNHKKS